MRSDLEQVLDAMAQGDQKNAAFAIAQKLTALGEASSTASFPGPISRPKGARVTFTAPTTKLEIE